MKKIKIINGRTQAFFLDTTAETVGQLIDALESDERLSSVDFSGVSLIQRDSQGRIRLEYPEQNISIDEEFKIFVIAEKMKFGDDVKIDVNGTEYSAKLLREMKTKINNLFEALLNGESIEEIIEQDEVTETPGCTVSEEDLNELDELMG